MLDYGEHNKISDLQNIINVRFGEHNRICKISGDYNRISDLKDITNVRLSRYINEKCQIR